MSGYKFATDSETGAIDASSFDDACAILDKMLPASTIKDGAWGWVEDDDGGRYTRCSGKDLARLAFPDHEDGNT